MIEQSFTIRESGHHKNSQPAKGFHDAASLFAIRYATQITSLLLSRVETRQIEIAFSID